MKITILTLFKDVFNEYLNSSIIKRAISKKIVEIEIIDFREYSKSKNKQVDDYQYGGGAGMVLMLEPIVEALRVNKLLNTKKIIMTPRGKTLNQQMVQELKTNEHITLICGHYEGFDERITNYIDEEISIGDYILTGGELPALVVIDAITRLLDNAINNESLKIESFDNNLLDYPVYTKPFDYEGYKVPQILLSGDHKKIQEYRHNEQIKTTKKYRNDLYQKYLKNKKGEKHEN